MHAEPVQLIELTHGSPEFDQVYEILSSVIAPEFLETVEFLRNRVRVRDQGPKTEAEKLLLQDGYTLHLIAAKQDGKVLGAVYGHLIAGIGADNQGIVFVTYIAVRPEHRRQGIGTMLIEALKTRVNEDALRLCSKPIIGIVYEIEETDKEEIKGCVSRLNARPLDIVYYQPAVRPGFAPERMDLWYQPCRPDTATETARTFTLPADLLVLLVRNLLLKEYVGPEMKGFDLTSEPYTLFLKSVGRRKEIGFLVREF
jgi:ribosomal protein S18 acetylase RimI-like enzyme